jgi:hypothetical protein
MPKFDYYRIDSNFSEDDFNTRPRIVNTDPVDLEQEVRLSTSTNISCTIDFGTSSQSDLPFHPWRCVLESTFMRRSLTVT